MLWAACFSLMLTFVYNFNKTPWFPLMWMVRFVTFVHKDLFPDKYLWSSTWETSQSGEQIKACCSDEKTVKDNELLLTERDLFQVITMSKYVLKIIVHYNRLDLRSSMVITDLLPAAPWIFLLAILGFFSSSSSWRFFFFIFLLAAHPVYISV